MGLRDAWRAPETAVMEKVCRSNTTIDERGFSIAVDDSRGDRVYSLRICVIIALKVIDLLRVGRESRTEVR